MVKPKLELWVVLPLSGPCAIPTASCNVINFANKNCQTTLECMHKGGGGALFTKGDILFTGNNIRGGGTILIMSIMLRWTLFLGGGGTLLTLITV